MLKIYLLFAQKHGLHLTQLISSHFFSEVWQKCAKFVLVQPGPLFSSFYTKSTIFVAEGVINKLVDNFFFVTFLSEVHHVLHLLHEV